MSSLQLVLPFLTQRIVLLDGGRVVETGTHDELVSKRGAYYELVKNQLELGN